MEADIQTVASEIPSNTGTLAMASAVNRRFAVPRLLKLASVLPVVTPRRERTTYTQVKFLQLFV